MAFKKWVCRDCGHEVYARTRPDPLNWTDGHTCYFIETEPDGLEEGAVSILRKKLGLDASYQLEDEYPIVMSVDITPPEARIMPLSGKPVEYKDVLTVHVAGTPSDPMPLGMSITSANPLRIIYAFAGPASGLVFDNGSDRVIVIIPPYDRDAVKDEFVKHAPQQFVDKLDEPESTTGRW